MNRVFFFIRNDDYVKAIEGGIRVCNLHIRYAVHVAYPLKLHVVLF